MKAFALSISTGLLLFMALPPHDLWPCAWIALVPLLVAIRDRSLLSSAACGLTAGAVTNFGGFYWLVPLMDKYSNLGFFSNFVMLGAAVYQGVPLMLWALLLRMETNWSGWRKPWALLVCAVSYPALEYFYPILFPWYLANTQHQVASILGPIELAGCALLSILIVSTNLVIARVLVGLDGESSGRHLWPAPLSRKAFGGCTVLVGLTLLSSVGFSVFRNRSLSTAMAQTETLQVGLVQPNHWIEGEGPMKEMFDFQSLTYQMIATSQEPLDLVIWPESSVRTPPGTYLTERGTVGDDEAVWPLDLESVAQSTSVPPDRYEQDESSTIDKLAIQRGHQTPILFGVPLRDFSPQAKELIPGRPPTFNCGVLLDEKGRVLGVAPKVELLLFGETVPFASYIPEIYKLIPLASVLMPGPEPTTFEFRDSRLGMMICYEDILPWFHYRLAQDEPQLLINLTNDAWFGKTVEAQAHLALAKLRSVEGRVFLLRATSTGVTSIVDPFGRLVAEVGQDKVGTLNHQVSLMNIKTGFEKWGNTAAWTSLVCLVAFVLGLGRKSVTR